jgi:predicted nucleic acid-binding protein
MVALLDSSILIAAERGKLDLEALLRSGASERFAFAAITASEILHGVHRAATPEQRDRREAFVEPLLSRLPVVPFDLAVARVHARLSADLAARGVNVGAHDLQIAATAIAAGGARGAGPGGSPRVSPPSTRDWRARRRGRGGRARGGGGCSRQHALPTGALGKTAHEEQGRPLLYEAKM